MKLRKKQLSASSDFEKFLKAYNCTYRVEKDEHATTYTFDFQAAHFVAAIRPQDDCVEITYPCMSTAAIDHLELVRSKCNERNNSNILFKFYYSIDNEGNKVDVHLSFFNNAVNAELIAHELGAAFHFQREWQRDFETAVDASKDSDNHDLESELYKFQREMYMVRRQELRHQFYTTDITAANFAVRTSPLTLWDLLETLSPLHQSILLFMTVNTVSGQQRIEDTNEIRNFDLRRALVEGDGKEARLVRDYAVLDLHYKQGKDEKPRMLTISLTAEGDDKITIYTRVTITVLPRNGSRMNSMSNEERRPHSTSLLIALDRYDDLQRRKECDYMWQDAQIKMRNGERDSMTEQELMLGQVEVADVAYNLYWGQKLFLAERFYEALLHLENVFNSYRSNFFVMSSDQKHTFMEVAYKIGFIYNELGLYKQAFYYLDLMASDGNIRHTMELINTMANSKDLRLFSYTEGVMEEVKRNFGNDEEIPDNIRDFVNFLRRRRGYAFIDFNDLDKAEKIFTAMLNEEENTDYAINELAYIKKLRQQRGEDTTTQPKGNSKDTLGSNDTDDQKPF